MSNLSELLPAGGAAKEFEVVASGTLPNGSPVVMKSDGTVEVVAESSATGVIIPAGTASVFNSAASKFTTVAFDLNTTGMFVIAYQDNTNSSYGTAVVGTVSGTSISFGSEYVFNSGITTWISVSFDPNTANKFVIAYQDETNSFYATAIIGTISGTSISYGSEAVLSSTMTFGTRVSFDPNTANKFVVTYRDYGGGDKGKGIVGTVSGTSISYGSLYVFNTAGSNYNSISFDPNTVNKFVIAYTDVGNSNYGTSIVGTVSGTSLVFGTKFVFNSGTSNEAYASFDPNTAGKFVVVYQDGGNSSYGTALVGTVSGTSISFSSTYIFNAGSSEYTEIAFDPNDNGKFVVAYKNTGNSNYGTAIVGDLAGTVTSTNLTSTNFAGTSTAAFTNGQTATIVPQGGVSTNQSSLTIGSTYYVQPAGTLLSSYKPYDIANATYDSVSFSVASEETRSAGLAFNTTGTKLYVIGNLSDSIFQYSLATAFDLSTASYSSISFSVASEDVIPEGLAFNTTGTKLYVIGRAQDNVFQYTLSTAFDLSTASYDSVSFSVTPQDTIPTDVTFNTDGSKMYIVGNGSDSILQYTLSTGFNLATASYDSVSLSVSSQGTSPQGMAFSSDGTLMYIADNSQEKVFQYSLATAFDLSTASYSSISFSTSGQDASLASVVFNSTGDNFYIIGAGVNTAYQYSTSPSDTSVVAGKAISTTSLILKGNS